MRVVAVIVTAFLAASPSIAQTQPVLVIDNAKTALATAEGGNAWRAIWVPLRPLPGRAIEKGLIGDLQYEPLRISFSPNQCTTLYAAINTMLDSHLARPNGSVFFADRRGIATSKISFENALVTELTLPGTSAPGEPWLIGVVLTPELSGLDRHPAQKLADVPPSPPPIVNGRITLSLSGLPAVDIALEPVVVVSTVEQLGESGGGRLAPPLVTIPQLRAVIPESAADAFFAWYEDFVILNSNSQSDTEKMGTLSYRSVNGQPLFDVSLQRVGISALKPVPDKGGYEATIYVEKMGITSAYSCPAR